MILTDRSEQKATRLSGQTRKTKNSKMTQKHRNRKLMKMMMTMKKNQWVDLITEETIQEDREEDSRVEEEVREVGLVVDHITMEIMDMDRLVTKAMVNRQMSMSNRCSKSLLRLTQLISPSMKNRM